MVKIVGSGLNVINVPVFFDLPMTSSFLRRFAALEFHRINFFVARDLDPEPVGQRIDTLRADTMQTAGIFVSALAEFSARMQIREHQFDSGHFPFRMHVHRNAASVVADGHRTVHVNRHLDFVAISGEMLVNRVVEHFKYTVMQTALVRVADIHARPLANGLQTFEFIYF